MLGDGWDPYHAGMTWHNPTCPPALPALLCPACRPWPYDAGTHRNFAEVFGRDRRYWLLPMHTQQVYRRWAGAGEGRPRVLGSLDGSLLCRPALLTGRRPQLCRQLSSLLPAPCSNCLPRLQHAGGCAEDTAAPRRAVGQPRNCVATPCPAFTCHTLCKACNFGPYSNTRAHALCCAAGRRAAAAASGEDEGTPILAELGLPDSSAPDQCCRLASDWPKWQRQKRGKGVSCNPSLPLKKP